MKKLTRRPKPVSCIDEKATLRTIMSMLNYQTFGRNESFCRDTDSEYLNADALAICVNMVRAQDYTR